MIKATMLAHSKNEFDNEIATMLVTFPRYILAEFNTHRMLSKNSASSRAIPFDKMIESVKTNPFIPMAWMANHKGMQGTEYLDQRDSEVCLSAWLVARNRAVEQALHLAERGLTKQIVNRVLEPYMYHTCVVTATEWENFFTLRCPRYNLYSKTEGTTNYLFRSRKDAIKACFDERVTKQSNLEWLECNKGQADIHMMALAEAMWDCMNESTPTLLEPGEWHIPYNKECVKLLEENSSLYPSDLNIGEIELTHDDIYTTNQKVKISTMMLARTSYTTIGEDGKEWKAEKYLEKHDELVNADPKHMSPFEHCARSMNEEEAFDKSDVTGAPRDNWSGNFKGFIQYRKMISNENITK